MSYPTEFRVKPGNVVLKFEFPCGGSLCKQVTPEYEEKFLTDPDFKAALIAKATTYFEQAKTAGSLVATHSTAGEQASSGDEARDREARDREARDREARDREERDERKWAEKEKEWADKAKEWAEQEKEWAKNERHSADGDENNDEVVLVDSNEETQAEVKITNSDSSGGPTCSRKIGAASRVAVRGGEIVVEPKHVEKRGLKRKRQAGKSQSDKKRPTATDASDEDAKAATLENLSKKKKLLRKLITPS
ncbi:hypothetical protein DAPPUDRAFT_257305 [Daphnia pulex]|uniref:Uncharacterized protein n=1 Tax=Daphnia pulex TaxID=6669 RepID=E9HDB2_DAPPU|nr:hypothetical protein DAPPUDRAFT_257305 [Daphnia pulex]|eukprot:EFX70279.1 hypothetical protein DAPPUDRAFT_257305 [Daphnia pulex]